MFVKHLTQCLLHNELLGKYGFNHHYFRHYRPTLIQSSIWQGFCLGNIHPWDHCVVPGLPGTSSHVGTISRSVLGVLSSSYHLAS